MDQTQKHSLQEIHCREMVQLLEDFYDIQEIQSSLYAIIEKQKGKLDTINNHIEDTRHYEIEGLKELEIAKKYSFKYVPIVIGSLVGASLLGPTSFLFGFKMGSIATGLGGGFLGGWCGYKIQK
tara:strand:+ start:48 stop:419 length:372 start_codon:yes stop_codon:yes gene_type:complete